MKKQILIVTILASFLSVCSYIVLAETNCSDGSEPTECPGNCKGDICDGCGCTCSPIHDEILTRDDGQVVFESYFTVTHAGTYGTGGVECCGGTFTWGTAFWRQTIVFVCTVCGNTDVENVDGPTVPFGSPPDHAEGDGGY